jgi:hypothetical protein
LLLSQGLRPIIQVIDEALQSEWQAVEAAYIEFYREEVGGNLLNESPGGDGCGSGRLHPRYGTKATAETRAKHSASTTGSRHHFFGKHQTPETKGKIRRARTGIKFSTEHRANLSAARRGKKLSPEQRAKISKAITGRNHPQFGKALSPKQRAKLSFAGRKHSRETRYKISASVKAIRRRKRYGNETTPTQGTLCLT